jgi:hypothetical protein
VRALQREREAAERIQQGNNTLRTNRMPAVDSASAES